MPSKLTEVSWLTENSKEIEDKENSPFSSSLKTQKKQEITVIFVGDIMLDRGVRWMVEKEGRGDFRFPFLKIAKELKTADIIFANLEGVISDKGVRVGSIYSFRVKPEAIDGLKFAGFNVLSLANNHAFDYSRLALEDCLRRLEKEGIDYVGAGFSEKDAYSPLIKEIKGVKIAFLAYTNLGPKSWRAKGENSGIAWISEDDFEKVSEDIKKAKENSDILIVSLHSGEEYQKVPSPFQIDFSRMAIDSGADLLIGHHPHVVQPVEKYKEGYIAYSLGNFIFDQGFSQETLEGLLLKVVIRDRKIRKVIPLEIKINEYFQPEISSVLSQK